jgi:SPP1 gp7 family putative phage head morphogenesis protein
LAKRAPADPDKFEEASKWFRGRTPVTKAEWNSMSQHARQTVFDSLQRAIDKGTPISQWRADIRKKLGDFADKNSATLTTAFINANQTAYNTGRYYQLTDPAVTAALPFLRLDAVLDPSTTEICKGLNGTTLKHDDPWWLTHWPPFHHRCRTTVRALSETMAKRRGGITKSLPRPAIPNDFGLAPPLRAGEVWEPTAADFDPAAWTIYQRGQAALKANDNADAKPKRKRRKD